MCRSWYSRKHDHLNEEKEGFSLTKHWWSSLSSGVSSGYFRRDRSRYRVVNDETTVLEIKATIVMPFRSSISDNISRTMMAKESICQNVYYTFRVFVFLDRTDDFFISSFPSWHSWFRELANGATNKTILNMWRFSWKNDDLMQNAGRKRCMQLPLESLISQATVSGFVLPETTKTREPPRPVFAWRQLMLVSLRDKRWFSNDIVRSIDRTISLLVWALDEIPRCIDWGWYHRIQ